MDFAAPNFYSFRPVFRCSVLHIQVQIIILDLYKINQGLLTVSQAFKSILSKTSAELFACFAFTGLLSSMLDSSRPLAFSLISCNYFLVFFPKQPITWSQFICLVLRELKTFESDFPSWFSCCLIMLSLNCSGNSLLISYKLNPFLSTYLFALRTFWKIK